ncbi:hypothetical protein FHR73_000916 [Pseudomonas sp. AS2.8]|nr:hypothetical protein [Pseudomonas sp. AS2.8]
MHDQPPIELGLLLYPGVQRATVPGLTDLFEIAGRLTGTAEDAECPRLRVSHWRLEEGETLPRRVYDSLPGGRWRAAGADPATQSGGADFTRCRRALS